MQLNERIVWQTILILQGGANGRRKSSNIKQLTGMSFEKLTITAEDRKLMEKMCLKFHLIFAATASKF